MTLEIQGSEPVFRILDTTKRVVLKARFHTRAQAEAWIEAKLNPPEPSLEQRVRTILHPGTMPGRASAHLLTREVLAQITRMGLPNAGYVPHDHEVVTEGCFRCELNKDE